MAEVVDVAVVGGGPAGLTAAATLCEHGAGRIVVLEREREAGGIPRHAQHQGFGVRDQWRMLSGPRYAERLAERAVAGGAELRTETQVTGWTEGGELELTSPRGREQLAARAVVLATGCRERPRSARLVPGSRPDGVFTTSTLQQLVYLHGERPGRRAVVVGAELVSFSALITLAHAGAEAVAMVTEAPRHATFGAVRAAAAMRFRAPLLTGTTVTAIHGRRRVEAVELSDGRRLQCDLVIFTADWIPDHELAVLGGVELDPGTRGPAVDASLRTNRPGLFAAGNALHGAEPADVAALSGGQVCAAVLAHLRGESWPGRIPILLQPPLGWIVPNAIEPRLPSDGRFLVRARTELTLPVVEVMQDEGVLWRGRLAHLGPGRSARLRAGWVEAVEPDGGPIVVRVLRARIRP
ncbi:MAG: NAD(P)/FAD-dependent oxidoreductase [Solirubrobacterales bacterium]